MSVKDLEEKVTCIVLGDDYHISYYLSFGTYHMLRCQWRNEAVYNRIKYRNINADSAKVMGLTYKQALCELYRTGKEYFELGKNNKQK